MSVPPLPERQHRTLHAQVAPPRLAGEVETATEDPIGGEAAVNRLCLAEATDQHPGQHDEQRGTGRLRCDQDRPPPDARAGGCPYRPERRRPSDVRL